MALIVLSAFLTIALERIYASATGTIIADPSAIAIPLELWALLGISTTSFVRSPLVLSAKIPQTATGGTLQRGASLRAAGNIAAIDAAEDASELQSELLKLDGKLLKLEERSSLLAKEVGAKIDAAKKDAKARLSKGEMKTEEDIEKN
ncbi:MAG: hypothetical protein NWE77_07030 [Candidatus Bathyarchaeota archaeon]|nr:hypothetical protein [Candidatus Bathyarchaeota archaeon]